MKTIYLFILTNILILPAFLNAQSVSISTDNSAPDVSAMLDIQSTNKGLLLPRVALTGITDVTTVPNAANGLFVFSENGNVPDGLYYWNDQTSKWVYVVTTNSITDFGSGKVITDAERTKLTDDADGSVTNELQTLALAGNQLTISSTGGNTVTFTGWDTNVADDITNAQVTSTGSGQIITAAERAKLNGIDNGADNVPVGTIVPFAGTTIPTGWLLCDGMALNPAIYGALSAALGTAWGNGSNDSDPVTTFNIPDLRGMFLRGVSGASGIDPDTSTTYRTALKPGGNTGGKVGSLQNAEISSHGHVAIIYNSGALSMSGSTSIDGNHNHNLAKSHDDGGQGGSVAEGDLANDYHNDTQFISANGNHSHSVSVSGANHNHSANIEVTGGSETRPVNVYVNYIIKY